MLDAFIAMVNTPEQKEIVEKLYNKYEQRIYKVAFAIMKNRQDAEDAVHDTFKWVIENIDRLNFYFDERTDALLGVVVRNVCKDKFRRRLNETLYLTEYVGDGYDLSEIDDLSQIEVNELINKLPEDITQVVALRYGAGYDPDVIAMALGISERTVYNRIGKAKKLIRKYIGGEK